MTLHTFTSNCHDLTIGQNLFSVAKVPGLSWPTPGPMLVDCDDLQGVITLLFNRHELEHTENARIFAKCARYMQILHFGPSEVYYIEQVFFRS